MSQGNNVNKAQQNKNTNNIEKSRVESAQQNISQESKNKFEKMAKLWSDFNRVGEKEEDILNGPMDILRQVGQFLVALSDETTTENTMGLVKGGVEQNLLPQGTGIVEVKKEIVAEKEIDIFKHLAERVLTSLPNAKTPEVHIKVADSVLPDTEISIKMVDGVLAVQIHSDNADAISLLSNQGAALQQLLESKTGDAVRVEVNSEMVTRKDKDQDNQDESNKKHKGQQEDNNENS